MSYGAPAPLAERFWAKVSRRGSGECWPWTGGVSDTGYGQLFVAGRTCAAHRLSWMLASNTAEIPPRMYVCHSCDNPICVNPGHLFVGTPTDNAQDMFDKGRHPVMRGTQNARAKLNDDQIHDIRAMHSSKRWNYNELSLVFGVSNVVIRKIVLRKSWKHL